MLYDRPYMRESSGYRDTAVLTWVMVAIVASFAVQQIASIKPSGALFVGHYFSLSPTGIGRGYFWTLLTYGFLHGSVLHLLFNLLWVYIFGRILLPVVGASRFLGFLFGAMLVGGLVWLGVASAFGLGIPVVGISAVCFGLLAIFATLYPDQPMQLLLLPLSVKPKHMAWAFAGVSLFCVAVFEIPGRDGTAHSAHLGGMLAGWLFARYIHPRAGEFSLRPSIELPSWMRRRKRSSVPEASTPTYTVNVSRGPDLKAEVDRILDKINSQGFGSLSVEERRLLDEARDLLNKR